jgi:hypothetical protein
MPEGLPEQLHVAPLKFDVSFVVVDISRQLLKPSEVRA